MICLCIRLFVIAFALFAALAIVNPIGAALGISASTAKAIGLSLAILGCIPLACAINRYKDVMDEEEDLKLEAKKTVNDDIRQIRQNEKNRLQRFEEGRIDPKLTASIPAFFAERRIVI